MRLAGGFEALGMPALGGQLHAAAGVLGRRWRVELRGAMTHIGPTLERVRTSNAADEYDRYFTLQVAASAHLKCGDLAIAKQLITSLGEFKEYNSHTPAMLAALEALLEIESGEEGLMLERLEPMMSDNVEPPWNAWLIGFYSGLASKAGHTKKAKRAAERAIGAMHEVWGEKNLALATPLTVLGEAELMDGNPELAVKYLELALSLRQDSDPMYKAETEFALARALSHTSDTAEYARLMGENALVHYADSGPRRAAERVEVEAWLAKLNAP